MSSDDRPLRSRCTVLMRTAILTVIVLLGIFTIVLLVGGQVEFAILSRNFSVDRPQIPLILLVLFTFLFVKIAPPDRLIGRIKPEKWFYCLFLVYLLLFVWIKITQYRSFNIHAEDFSCFDYAFFNAFHGRGFHDPFHGESLLKIHFAPDLFFFVPLYAVFAGPYLLLVLQALILALSSVPLFYIALRVLGHDSHALLVVLVYLNGVFLMKVLMYDFHWEILFPLSFFLLHFLELKNARTKYIFGLLLTLAVKEDIALYMIFYGLYLVAKKSRFARITLVISGLWLVVALSVLFWVNRGDIAYFHRWRYFLELGLGNIPAVLGRVHGEGLFRLLLPLAFVPLLAWRMYLVSLVPTLVNITSLFEPQFKLGLHYSVTVLPFLFIAFVEGMRKLRDMPRFSRSATFLLVFTLLLNIGQFRTFTVTPRHRMIHRALQEFVGDGSVMTQVDLIPHIRKRREIYVLKMTFADREPDWVIFDRYGNRWPLTDDEYETLWNRFLNNPAYRVVYRRQGLVILNKRPPHPGPGSSFMPLSS